MNFIKRDICPNCGDYPWEHRSGEYRCGCAPDVTDPTPEFLAHLRASHAEAVSAREVVPEPEQESGLEFSSERKAKELTTEPIGDVPVIEATCFLALPCGHSPKGMPGGRRKEGASRKGSRAGNPPTMHDQHRRGKATGEV